jgi:hypothetical protein
MSPEELERVLETARMPVSITEDRVERVIDTVFARIDAAAARPPRGWAALLAAMLEPILPARFAYILAAALLVGISVGRFVEPATTSGEEAPSAESAEQFLPLGS